MLHPPRKKEGFTCRFADFYSNCQGASAVAVTTVNDRRSGDGRARTGDPLLAKQVLSQLSYAPKPSSGRPSRCGRRGPFWIRTRDLTVISRALSPTELKARGARCAQESRASRDAARPAARVIDMRVRAIEPLTSEAWRDLSASDDEGLDTGATAAPVMLCRFPLPTGVPPPAPANRRWNHSSLHPGTSSRLASLLFAVPRRALLHDLS
jgi:hypothetical protein